MNELTPIQKEIVTALEDDVNADEKNGRMNVK